MRKVRAGTLRHNVIIQREIITQDSMGAVIKSWTNIKVTRASVDPITGNEHYLNDHILSDVDHQIVVRFTDVVPADRIIFKSRIFDIKRSLDFQERKNHLVILAKERLTQRYVSNSKTRVTENDDVRITENGKTRVTED